MSYKTFSPLSVCMSPVATLFRVDLSITELQMLSVDTHILTHLLFGPFCAHFATQEANLTKATNYFVTNGPSGQSKLSAALALLKVTF